MITIIAVKIALKSGDDIMSEPSILIVVTLLIGMAIQAFIASGLAASNKIKLTPAQQFNAGLFECVFAVIVYLVYYFLT